MPSFIKVPKFLRTLAEAMEYEPADVALGLAEASNNPITRKLSQTLNQKDLDVAAALADARTMENAEFMRDNALAFSPHFRSYFGDSLIVDPKYPVLQMPDGSRVARPEQLYHGSLSKDIEVFDSANHPRHDGGDNGEWLSNDINRAKYYAGRDGGVYNLYAKVENPVVFDALGERWNDIGASPVLRYAGLNEPNTITVDELDDLVKLYKRDRYRGGTYGPKFLNSLYDEMTKYVDFLEREYPDAVRDAIKNAGAVLTGQTNKFDNAYDYGTKLIETSNNRAKELGNFLTNSGNNVNGFGYANGIDGRDLTYEFTRELKAKHGDTVDGVRMNNIQDGGHWGNHADNIVVFKPNTIKSSDNNNGLFRLDDPRITHGIIGIPTLGEALDESWNPIESVLAGAGTGALAGGGIPGAIVGGAGGLLLDGLMELGLPIAYANYIEPYAKEYGRNFQPQLEGAY